MRSAALRMRGERRGQAQHQRPYPLGKRSPNVNPIIIVTATTY
jgi:hypothetical protein